MMMTNCWSCGARLSGPTCQMCGAAQHPESSQPPAMSGGPSGQPVVSQASMSIRPSSNAGMYVSGEQRGYVPGRQPDMGGYPQNGPYQQPGMSGSSFYQQAGYEQPYQTSGAGMYVPGGQPQRVPPPQMMGPQPVAPAIPPAMQTESRWAETLSTPLALLGGLVAAVVGAAIWGFLVDLTHINFSYLAFGLGILVGLGVALGARGYNDIGLSLFAGVLGLFSFFLAMYFRLSLRDTANLFALSLDDYLNVLGNYLTAVPINFLNFILVPAAAMGTAYRYINRGRR